MGNEVDTELSISQSGILLTGDEEGKQGEGVTLSHKSRPEDLAVNLSALPLYNPFQIFQFTKILTEKQAKKYTLIVLKMLINSTVKTGVPLSPLEDIVRSKNLQTNQDCMVRTNSAIP